MGSLDNNLYILHGWTTSVTRWEPFLEKLKTTGIEPVFLKIPGLTSPIDRAWGIDDYVEWLNKELPAGKRLSLLGHSNGGRIILSFALQYPERVEQLFLLDSAGLYHNDLFTRTKRNVFKALSTVGKRITQSAKARDLLYRAAAENDYNNATPVMKETMKNLIAVNLLPNLSKIQLPVTIIWGRNDQVTPYTDAMVMKNELSNSQIFPIQNASHSPQFTNTDEVVNIIKSEFK